MSLYIPTRPAVVKAGPIGPGSGVMLTEFPLSRLSTQQTPQAKMRQAMQMGIEVPWIRNAERVISGRVQSLGWHLEDDDENTVDDDYTDADAQAVRTLLEKPQAALPTGNKMFRGDMWRLTERHVGLAGNAFWYLDGLNTFGEPNAIIYIRPDRMFADEDNNGNLTGWHIDKTATNPGIPVSLEQIIHYVLDPPDYGHFGIGLVETAWLTATNSQGLERHLSMLISAGGRIAGLLSPKAGQMASEQMTEMERGYRTIVDQSDAAKRLQILAAPVDYTKVALTPQELQLIDFMTNERDALLSLWGVPMSMVGIHDKGKSGGMGAGLVADKDNETLWDNGIKPRLASFTENIQYRLLDPLTTKLQFILELPAFDDDAPAYENGSKAVGMPLTNNQRLEILGYDPIDPLVMGPLGGPLGSEIVLPPGYAPYANATKSTEPPAPAPIAAPAPMPEMDSAATAAGETPQSGGVPGKALIRPATPSRLHPRVIPLHTSLVALRSRIESAKTPILRRNVHDVLAEQKSEIVASLRKNAAHLERNRSDSTLWFPAKRFDAKLTAALAPHLDVMANSVNAAIGDVLPPKTAKAAPAVERVLARGAARVTGINETTRQKINDAIQRGLDAGSSVLDVADAIEAGTSIGGLDLGALFDDYRAEMIARTELMDAYNSSAINSYSDAGVEYVEAIDGDGDPECAERDGQTYSTDEADSIEDHPNGTLDWIPVLPDEEGKAIVSIWHTDPVAAAQANVVAANQTFESVSAMAALKASLDAQAITNAHVERLLTIMSNTPAPTINLPAPIVNIAAADPDVHNIAVNVPAQPAPIFNVPATEPPVVHVHPAKPSKKTVTKRNDGSYVIE